MLFLNAALLAGLGALLVPVLLHLWSKRKKQFVEWAAMQFLVSSLEIRQRKIELEDVLLMIARCLVVGLLALTIARPFIPEPGSAIPWGLVVPLGLLGIAALGATAALWHDSGKRAAALVVAVLAFFGCWRALESEQDLQKERFGDEEAQDVVIIVDASASMAIERDGTSGFDRALTAARGFIETSNTETAFALVLGGRQPQELTSGLTIDRESIAKALGAAEQGRGSMDAVAALASGLEILENGRHPNKKLVMMTDRQALGWDTTDDGRWGRLTAGVEALPNKPSLLLWDIPFPKDYRNVALIEARTTDSLIKKEHPCSIVATYENTGKHAITPLGFECIVDGTTHTNTNVTQLAPGATAQIHFELAFKESGPHPVTIRMLGEDDVASDNTITLIAQVADRMRVLVADDGTTHSRYFDRGSAYVRLALEASQNDEVPEDQPLDYVYESIGNVTAELLGEKSINTVWLAGVQALSEETRGVLGEFVYQGGGLIVSAAQEMNANVFNTWTAHSHPLLPANVVDLAERSRIEDRVHVDLKSLKEGPLGLLSDGRTSDLDTALFSHFWKVIPRGTVQAQLSTGQPLLLSHEVGRGKVWMVTVPLTAEASSLVTRDCFLPLVEELVTATAGMGSTNRQADLNVPGAARIDLTLSPTNVAGDAALPSKVTTPDQRTFNLEVTNTSSGVTASFPWDGTGGLHYLQLPEKYPLALSKLTDEANRVPFAVLPDVAESRSQPLTASDIEIMRSVFHVLEVTRVEDARQVMSGLGFGEELWRLFALGALVFLILELALARWVAFRRQLGKQLRAGVPATS